MCHGYFGYKYSNSALNAHSNSQRICLDHLDHSKCIGVGGCFDLCYCFQIPSDWQPGWNDWYTITVSFVLLCIVSTSISFGHTKCNQLLYLQLISIGLMLFTCHWFISTVILRKDRYVRDDYALFSYGFLGIIIYFKLIIIPSTWMTSVSYNFSSFKFKS